jgi:hypothetical protein
VEQVTHEHTVITPQDIWQHRTALHAWAEANGIDPDTVAVAPITIRQRGDHSVIEYQAFALDEGGRTLVDPQQDDQPLTIKRTTRLVSGLALHGIDAGQLGA